MIKSSKLAAAAAATLLVSVNAQAATPKVPDDGYITHYAVNSEILDRWHGGVQGFAAKRNVEAKRGGFLSEMDAKRVNAYVGFDVFRWFTVYGLGGVLNVKNTKAFIPSDTTTVWGGGAMFSLLDDDQLDFLDTISRYRLSAGVEASYSDPNDLEWKQYDAWLTFEILNDTYLSDALFPTQIGLFCGPVFSKVDMEGYEQVDDNDWGFEAGMSLRFADGIFVQGAYEWFGDDSVAAFSAGFRF